MITKIIAVVMILYVMDLVWSYNYMKKYRTMFPKGDWAAVEANPIIRYAIRVKGLGEGIIMGGIIVFVILAVLIRFSAAEFHWFLAGMYYMMNVFHFLNLMALGRLRNLKNQKGGKKKNGKKEKSSRRPRRNNRR